MSVLSLFSELTQKKKMYVCGFSSSKDPRSIRIVLFSTQIFMSKSHWLKVWLKKSWTDFRSLNRNVKNKPKKSYQQPEIMK